MPVENVPEGHKPYHWHERREAVMARMPNVLNWVQPIGSTVPYQKRMTDGDESRELAWLIRTQHMDLAPQWQEFAANGLHASSLIDENGEMQQDISEEDTRDENYSLALAAMYETGRREQFAHDRDYQTWHTSPVRRAWTGETTDGKVTAKARWGSEFTEEELMHFIENFKVARDTPDPEPLTQQWSDELDWLDTLDRDPQRDEFRISDEQERYDEDRVGYAAGDTCPNTFVIIAGTAQCDNGAAPVYDMPDGMFGPIVLIDWADCPTCQGTGLVQSLLGTTISALDEDILEGV